MTQQHRTVSQTTKAKEAEGFGAVRLPAVAAAMQQAKRQPAEAAKPKEWPAFLRKEEIFG